MTVFEFQVDPDRNAIIRRALAKRIVRQREVEDEEASTEEDESFLENSLKLAVVSGAAARKGTIFQPNDFFFLLAGGPTGWFFLARKYLKGREMAIH